LRAQTRGIVESIEEDRPDLQRLLVRQQQVVRSAVNYVSLTGPAAVGDGVTINTWAADMGLGTGGVDFVMQVHPGGLPPARPDIEAEAPGHIIKLRYTPLQHPILAAEAPESPFHDALRGFQALGAIPVVCAELHSQIAGIATAAKWETQGQARVVYVMTDAASLPIAFSRMVPELQERGIIDATVTAGQAFGGNFEAVNIYSALAVARVAAEADIIVVCQGPGSVGTGTPLGFSGVDQGISLNAVTALGGTAICAVRLSFADPRPRHIGLSHHTRTVLERITTGSVFVAIPRLPEPRRSLLHNDLQIGGLAERHEIVTIDAEGGLTALVDTGLQVTTMGRKVTEERAFFLAAAAAGQLAGQIANEA
jgi:hypothetical protein